MTEHINDLDIAEPDPIDWDNRTFTGAGRTIAPKGQYSLITTEPPQKGATMKDRKLQYTFTFRVVGGEADGTLIKYQRFNTIKKSWAESNGLADYLAGFGLSGPFGSNAEYSAAVDATNGRPFKAGVDWEGSCPRCKTKAKGMEAFPLVDGARQGWKLCPNGCERLDKEGNVVKDAAGNVEVARIYANNVVKYVMSAVKK